MSWAGVRFGVGTRLVMDGETVEIVELAATQSGNEVIVRDSHGRIRHVSQRELLLSGRARVIPDVGGPSADDPYETAGTVLAGLSPAERSKLAERAAHIEEALTGYKSGSPEVAEPGEPRPEYDPALPFLQRYAAKASELGVGRRTFQRWVSQYADGGQAGLARTEIQGSGPLGRADPRWVEMALAVMGDHQDESTATKKTVVDIIEARLETLFGAGVVALPSQPSAYRYLDELERQVPTFRGSAKRRREIADRPRTTYGRLRPVRPGEFLLLDTTRSDVFALDPRTMRWVQAEVTVAMDWYTRCITGLRVTPVSTKAVDVSAVLYRTFRPRPAGETWPAHAVWPEHGLPRHVLVDTDAWTQEPGAGGPALVPEAIVIDHGKVYVSAHVTSVCRRMGISIQPARVRTGRDKGPVERFFRTLREGLLEALPGYKGPDVYSRGLNPEGDAFLFLDELEAIIAEWIAVVYHHRPHHGLVDAHLPGLELSPAMMFEHGVARAGYVEVPRDPDLGFEFLNVKYVPIHHYGVELNGCRYNGDGLDGFREKTSPYLGAAKGRWPIHFDVDDISHVYFRHPRERTWHALDWEHAPMLNAPFSMEALELARRAAAAKYKYPDDRLALSDLLSRWNMGLGMDRTERRMALRIAREQAAIELPDTGEDEPVRELASVRKVLEAASSPSRSAEEDEPEMQVPQQGEAGDDDDLEELDLVAPPEADSPDSSGDFDDDFYSTAIRDTDDD
jgi:transposase InsO family protein